MKLEGINAVVTGGASGIGRAAVEALLARNCSVVIADIDTGPAEDLAATYGERVHLLTCNVRQPKAIADMVEESWTRLGHVDFVFANAGVCPSVPLLQASEDLFDFVYEVNIRGSWSTCVHFARRMIAEGRKGHLCVTGSEHSIGLQHLGAGQYTASKHAVLGWADVLRGELPDTVKMSVLCPGVVATNLYDATRNSEFPPPDEKSKAFGAALMGKGMGAAEVASILLQGIEDESFLIPTHGVSYWAAEKRFDEIKAAWYTYSDPDDPGAREYSVNKIAADLVKQLKAQR